MTINNPEYYTYRPTKLKVSRLGVNISDELNASLNLRPSEYMIVGEQFVNHGGYTSNLLSLIVDDEGIAVNCSLSNRRINASDYAVQLYGNTYLDGNLIVKGIISTGGTSNSSGGSSNFWRYAGENNIYYNGNVTIGNYIDAATNQYSFNISEAANYNINKAQVAVQNRQNSVFRMSILGESSNSPMVMNTLPKVPLEFHVGRTQDFFQRIYRKSFSNYGEYITIDVDSPNYTNIYDAPHLNIDVNGNVGIKTNYNQPLNYILRKRDPVMPNTVVYQEEYASAAMHIEGTMYACNILMYDYETGVPKSLDQLYIRTLGISLPACNIVPGSFARGNFTFTSNLSIFGPIDNSRSLKVYGSTEVTSNVYVGQDIVAGKDLVADSLFIHNSGSFSNNVVVQNNIYFKANLYKQRQNLETGSNEWALLQFDDRFFEKPTLSNIYYIGDGIATVGRLGVGADPVRDEVNHQMVVTKRDPSYFELELSDKSTLGYQRAAFIGHPTTSTDFRSDGSLVFLTPGVRDNNFNNIYGNGEQNIYFYPGFTQRISQFRIEACNVPTFGVFVNNRVGIRTFSPTHALDVNGDIAVTGSYYVKLPTELDPVKLGIWRDNSYSYIINGNQATFKGIQYYNPSAPHVGINTIAQPEYGAVVSGKLLSLDGYYTSDGNRIVPFFNSFEIFGKPTPAYETMYTNGKLGVGVLFPQGTLHLRDTRGPTTIKLSQGTTSPSIIHQFSGNHNEFMWHMNDELNTFELYQGPSNQIYNQSNLRPILVHRTPNNTYQIVVNSNIGYAKNKPSDVLLVNGNVDIKGDINITGSYRVQGATILIAGSQAQYYTDNTNPDNIYIAGENIYMNTNSEEDGAIYVGWGGATSADYPAEVLGGEFDKSAIYVRQKSTANAFVTKYDSRGYYCLTQYKNSRDNTAIVGVTNRNAFYIGNSIDVPYITVSDLGGNRNTIGIGTNNPNDAKLQVFTPDQQSVARFTRYSLTPDVDDFVADITLEKIVDGTDSHAWKIQGPNQAHQQKLQFMYLENNTSNEVICITKDGCIGIGNTRPTFALDILEMGDQGSIRMLQTNTSNAKPQLLFQCGSNQYGADFSSDYRMYAFQNNFYLDMQDAMIGQKILLHFTSNNAMGIHQTADSRYGVSIGGSLNVRDSIFINGRPFFSVGDSILDLGTFIQGYNIFLNPEASTYGGVTVNGASVTSNIFQVNSAKNGNTGVFSSDYLQSLIHFRNVATGNEKRLWRTGTSNNSFIMEYRSNIPTNELFISDNSINYARASEFIQSETVGEFVQKIQGSLQLHARNPKVVFNVTSELGASNQQMYIMTSNFGIGTYQPIAKLHVYNQDMVDSIVVHQTNTLSNIAIFKNYEDKQKLVINAYGNVGIGTTLVKASLDVVGQVYLTDGSSNQPSYSFASATNTGLYVDHFGLQTSMKGVLATTVTNTGGVGIGTILPSAHVHIFTSNVSAKSSLRLSQYTDANILEVYSNIDSKVVINSLGNVGVGTTLPQYPLHITGSLGLDGAILPNVDATYNLGSSSKRWKDLYLSGASLYLDNLFVSKYTTDKVSFCNVNGLVPIVTDSLFLGTLDQNPVILTKDSANLVNLPKFMTSNISSGIRKQYTPIVIEHTSNVVGVGTYATKGYMHVYSSNSFGSDAFVVSQYGGGKAMVLEGTNFLDKAYQPFTVNVTNDGKMAVGGEADANARVTLIDNNYNTVLLLNQQNDYQDIMRLYHQNIQKTVFDKDGYLGIGTAAPQSALHVIGKTIINHENTESSLHVYGNSTFSSNVNIYGKAYVQGDLEIHGNFINDSDRRIKYDIQPIESALSKIQKLSGYTFYKTDQPRRETGVIAQEIQEVLPEAVFENDKGVLGVAYGNLVGLLIEGIKELSLQLEEIKAKIN